jgi:hypothetical protein
LHRVNCDTKASILIALRAAALVPVTEQPVGHICFDFRVVFMRKRLCSAFGVELLAYQ